MRGDWSDTAPPALPRKGFCDEVFSLASLAQTERPRLAGCIPLPADAALRYRRVALAGNERSSENQTRRFNSMCVRKGSQLSFTKLRLAEERAYHAVSRGTRPNLLARVLVAVQRERTVNLVASSEHHVSDLLGFRP